jgi:hypothetical protein
MPTPGESERYHRLQLVLSLAGFALGIVYLLAIRHGERSDPGQSRAPHEQNHRSDDL